MLGDPGADLFGEQQQRLVAVVGRRQGIHPIHQIDQVGLALDAGRQREILQHIPAGVVVEDGQGHRLEGGEAPDPLVTHLAVGLGAAPVEALDQVAMDAGGRHADVVEHPELEEKGDFVRAQALDPPALGGHHADPLAVGHVIHTDQIERIGQGMDHLAKIHIERHSGTSRAGGAWEQRPPHPQERLCAGMNG